MFSLLLNTKIDSIGDLHSTLFRTNFPNPALNGNAPYSLPYHKWQSCVEIKDYSIAYFDNIAAFEVP